MSKIKIENNKARAAFKRWRNKKQRTVPLGLRTMAVSLSHDHGCKQTCKELGLSTATLWKWRQEGFTSQPTKRNRKKIVRRVSQSRTGNQESQMPFVELASAMSQSAIFSPVSIEWQRADGGRMRLEGRIEMDDLDRLASSFLKGKAGES